jgi:hypothetical protein
MYPTCIKKILERGKANGLTFKSDCLSLFIYVFVTSIRFSPIVVINVNIFYTNIQRDGNGLWDGQSWGPLIAIVHLGSLDLNWTHGWKTSGWMVEKCWSGSYWWGPAGLQVSTTLQPMLCRTSIQLTITFTKKFFGIQSNLDNITPSVSP